MVTDSDHLDVPDGALTRNLTLLFGIPDDAQRVVLRRKLNQASRPDANLVEVCGEFNFCVVSWLVDALCIQYRDKNKYKQTARAIA